MNRRDSDSIRHRIDEWERLRADCSDAGPGVTRFVDHEIDRLRFELTMRTRPRPDGRRASDHGDG